ncbi:hypothetical protein KCP70_25570 [Salmonella enterica subsp. enterica]|nr:hypothetical protein KCP70_25570 [Salmonella enterica subsp. enterica]
MSFHTGGGRQYDIGVQAGARQAEVQRHHQIQFAVEAIVTTPLLPASHRPVCLDPALNTNAPVPSRYFSMYSPGAPEEQAGRQVTRVVLPFSGCSAASESNPLSSLTV